MLMEQSIAMPTVTAEAMERATAIPDFTAKPAVTSAKVRARFCGCA